LFIDIILYLRPKLEYASAVWNSNIFTDANKLERMQQKLQFSVIKVSFPTPVLIFYFIAAPACTP